MIRAFTQMLANGDRSDLRALARSRFDHRPDAERELDEHLERRRAHRIAERQMRRQS